VRAVYRNGIGAEGNVRAGQISMLKTRPLGAKEVINPLPSSGGAGREDRDQGRENAPVAVMALDRLVSLADYSAFSRTFAGIAKADAQRLSDGQRQLVHITIAGADDIPIDENSGLYRNLVAALRKYGDPALPIQVDRRELKILVLGAKVRLAPGYLWDPVSARIRARLFDQLGFRKRALGQPALLCEAISLIQNVEGVSYVDVDLFGGIPEKAPLKGGYDGGGSEKETPASGEGRQFLTFEQMAKAIDKGDGKETPGKPSSSSGPPARVTSNLAAFEAGEIRPAQLAIFVPAVPDTVILNQIL
jgi:hypothetical protein